MNHLKNIAVKYGVEYERLLRQSRLVRASHVVLAVLVAFVYQSQRDFSHYATKILRRNSSRRVRRDSTVRARVSLRCCTTFSCLSFGLERLYSFPLAHLRHILYPPP
jgi:hypothetical protein